MGGLCFSCSSDSHDRQLQQSRAKGAASSFPQPVAPKLGIVLQGRAVTSGVTCLAQIKSQRSGSQSKLRALAWETGNQPGERLVDSLLLHWRPLFRWAGAAWDCRAPGPAAPVKCCNCKPPVPCAMGPEACSDGLTLQNSPFPHGNSSTQSSLRLVHWLYFRFIFPIHTLYWKPLQSPVFYLFCHWANRQ